MINRLGLSALALVAMLSGALAQTALPPKGAQLPVAPLTPKCLKALNGTCTNPVLVEIARQRAQILPAVTVSYFGTPAGSVGGDYIPFERFFRDNAAVFGLPAASLFVPGCCIRRSR